MPPIADLNLRVGLVEQQLSDTQAQSAACGLTMAASRHIRTSENMLHHHFPKHGGASLLIRLARMELPEQGVSEGVPLYSASSNTVKVTLEIFTLINEIRFAVFV